jgi:HD superfamily phosphodiesterase
MYKPLTNSEMIRLVAEKNNDFVVAHTIRVVDLALQLSKELNANSEIVTPASFFHDIEFYNGFLDHGARGANVFRERFSGIYGDIVAEIIHCIESHPVKYAPDPKTIEAKCLRDADRIDSILSFVPQRYLVARKSYDNEESAWRECNERIKGWYDSMVTPLGRQQFLSAFQRMQKIFPQLIDVQISNL